MINIAIFYKIIVAAQSVVTTSDLLYHYRKRIGSVTKTPSMENLRNHWAAYHARYECVVKLVADTPENASAKRWMSMEIASAAIRPFRWICGIPKKERDTELIRSVSEFLRHNFKATGDKGWSLNLRVSAFLARRPNALSCAVMYLASRVYVKKVRITEGRELYP